MQATNENRAGFGYPYTFMTEKNVLKKGFVLLHRQVCPRDSGSRPFCLESCAGQARRLPCGLIFRLLWPLIWPFSTLACQIQSVIA